MATKLVAKKLGLIQTCNVQAIIPGGSKREQIVEYLLVLDFEATCWETKVSGSPPEIIEFPVVLFEISTGKTLAEFHQYVLPLEYPILSDFCIHFTGIQQSDVDNGFPLAAAIALFAGWLRKVQKEFEFSVNLETPGKHAAFATWSDWDLGVCLRYECSRKCLKKPGYFNQWIDIRAAYKNFYKRRPDGLAGALHALGMNFEGREHSGISDARNTAALIGRMAKDGCVFEITKYKYR